MQNAYLQTKYLLIIIVEVTVNEFAYGYGCGRGRGRGQSGHGHEPGSRGRGRGRGVRNRGGHQVGQVEHQQREPSQSNTSFKFIEVKFCLLKFS